MITLNTRTTLKKYPENAYDNITEIEWNIGKLIKCKLQKFPHIKKFICKNNFIVSLQALAMTKLEYLDCSNNLIVDITPVNLIDTICVLDLSNNPINKLDLSLMTNLSIIKLNNTLVDNLTGLTNCLNIKYLECCNVQLSNLLGIESCLNLTNLLIDNNNLTNLSSINNLTNITTLSANNNKLTNLSDLSKMVKLESLSVNNNQIAQIDDIKSLESLTELNIANNLIESIEVIINFKSLEKFSSNNNLLSKPSIAVRRLLEKIGINEIMIRTDELDNLDNLDYTNNSLDLHQIETEIVAGNFENVDVFVEKSPFVATNLALEYASYYNNFDTVKKLISYGADVNSFGHAAITSAITNGNISMLKYLVEKCVINGSIFYGFIEAVKNNQIEIVKYLLEINTNDKYFTVNDSYGLAVKISIEHQHTDITKMLLDNGADPLVLN